jgi:hypothetical protein
MFNRILFVLLIGLISGCGGGSSGGGGGASQGTLVGKVSDNSTGTPVSGVTVTDGTVTSTTATDGTYTLANAAAASDKAISFSKVGYAAGSKIATVTASGTTRVDVALLPVAYTTAIASQTSAQTLSVPSSSGQVALPANGLVTASGSAPSGAITANLTPIDPSSNPQLMPGNYTTSAGGIIESFGAMEVTFKDASGGSLNLASGKTATIRIPVAASAASPPATMPAFYYNSSTGKWVQEGTLTLGGTAPNQYYEGTVTHFTYWNADQVYNTTCITGKVVQSDGVTPQPNAKVEAQGSTYTGTSQAWTAADGTFTLQVKASSTVIVTASTSTGLSQSEIVITGAAGNVCSALTTDQLLILGSTTTGSAKIRLTWGTDPSDLDSHLTGPMPASAPRFHVYFSSKGTLTSPPYAELDVDDTSSFGPEVITINRFMAGTYRYSIHHYSGSGNIFTSPARVELQLNGVTRVFTPPDPGATVIGDDSVWVVFELVVDSAGVVTINPVNTYQLSVSASSVTKPVLGSFDEYFLYRSLPKK